MINSKNDESAWFCCIALMSWFIDLDSFRNRSLPPLAAWWLSGFSARFLPERLGFDPCSIYHAWSVALLWCLGSLIWILFETDLFPLYPLGGWVGLVLAFYLRDVGSIPAHSTMRGLLHCSDVLVHWFVFLSKQISSPIAAWWLSGFSARFLPERHGFNPCSFHQGVRGLYFWW